MLSVAIALYFVCITIYAKHIGQVSLKRKK
jgi:hypothetical protein